jgi:simple sugar transport system ATP-binding protein
MTTTTETQKKAAEPLVRLTDAGKNYGSIIALSDVSLEVSGGEVTCVLGDNGAGKSTLIKIIAGLHQPSVGTYEVEGTPVSFSSPREALERGIATVYQDLAVVSLMPVWRNFFLGNEKRKGLGMDIAFMKKTCKQELLDMGIDLRDVEQPIGTLSGGERQCVAIARAVHFGAKVLILDEPTAALGVKQAGVVLSTSSRPGNEAWESSSSPTTRTTHTRWVTGSCCSTAAGASATTRKSRSPWRNSPG